MLKTSYKAAMESRLELVLMKDPRTLPVLLQAEQFLLEKLPHLRAIYLFGSFATAYQRRDSDIDLALLGDQLPSGGDLWLLSQELACLIHRQVDLVDLKQSSTIFRYQVIAEGTRLFTSDPLSSDQFELQTLSRYYHFKEARKGLVEEYLRHIAADG